MFGKYFCGNEISEYGRKHGRVDYATLAKAFDAVLANDIMTKTANIGYWEGNGNDLYFEDAHGNIYTEAEAEEKRDEIERELEEVDEDSEEAEAGRENLEALEEYHYQDIYQFYIVSEQGAELLEEYGEIVFYNSELDLYVWGVTHYGTSWSYVLTSIPCEVDETARA